MKRRNARTHFPEDVRFGQFHREPDRGDHAVGPGDALAGDRESSAVIGAGARKWESECDVHTFMERVQLQRDQSLIVIHAKDRVEFSLDRPVENGVGRERAEKMAMTALHSGVTAIDCSCAIAGAMISISSRPSAPDSPACGLRPATAIRLRPPREEKVCEQRPNSHDLVCRGDSWPHRAVECEW